MKIQGIPSPGDGLRLHLNENTGGCSPRVIEAIRTLTPTDIAAYPDYKKAVLTCAEYFQVNPEELLLTNGLDEGILMVALANFGRAYDPEQEAIVPVPAFDPYLTATAAVGAKVIRVPPGPNFAFPVDEVITAISPKTRLIFLNTPNNPTGQIIPHQIIRRVIDAAPQATVLVDEAYVEFANGSFLDELSQHSNVVLGRTFSKAYGMAGMRIGCLIAKPGTIDPIRKVIPIFNMNVVAITAMQAAVKDQSFLPAYTAEVKESRQRLYEACRRLDLEYWESSANFVLVRVGKLAPKVVAALDTRGIHVRDRSQDPYSPGCIRITAGVLSHTDEAIKALEANVSSGLIETRGAL